MSSSTVVFKDGLESTYNIHRVVCDNPNINFVMCPYLNYLSKHNYREIDMMEKGANLLYIDLEFWCHYASKEKNLRYPKSFCDACQWNRER